MKNHIIITLNVNAYAHTLTNLPYGERLQEILSIVRSTTYNDCKQLPSIVALQEVILGQSEMYLGVIQEKLPEYKIIKPYNFDTKAYKSAVNLLLIRKDVLIRYVAKRLSDKEDHGNYLYNYISLNCAFGKCLIFNLHLPQLTEFNGRSTGYKAWRKEMRECLLKSIYSEIAQNPNAKIILLGDLNALESSKEIITLKSLDMINITEKKATHYNANFGEKAIDYIFVSANTLTADSDILIHTALVDNNISKRKLTDHALIKTLLSAKDR